MILVLRSFVLLVWKGLLLDRTHGKCLLRAALYAGAAFDTGITVDLPGLGCTVDFDRTDRALLRAERAVDALLGIEYNTFGLRLREGKDLLRALADTDAALYALLVIHLPGLGGAVHGDGVLRAVPCAETTVDTVVDVAGKVADDLLLEGHALDQQILVLGSYHVVVLGHLDRAFFTEVDTGRAEGTGGQVKSTPDILAAFDFLALQLDRGRRTYLDAHSAVNALFAVKGNAAAVIAETLAFRTRKRFSAGFGECVGDRLF